MKINLPFVCSFLYARNPVVLSVDYLLHKVAHPILYKSFTMVTTVPTKNVVIVVIDHSCFF